MSKSTPTMDIGQVEHDTHAHAILQNVWRDVLERLRPVLSEEDIAAQLEPLRVAGCIDEQGEHLELYLIAADERVESIRERFGGFIRHLAAEIDERVDQVRFLSRSELDDGLEERPSGEAPASAETVWTAAMSVLETQVSTHNFESWLQIIEPVELSGESLQLQVGDSFQKAWIDDNYLDLIESAVAPLDVELVVDESLPEPEQAKLPMMRPTERAVPNSVARSSLFGVVKRGRRKQFEKQMLATLDGTQIRYTGAQLDQHDLDVWMQALELTRDQELGEYIEFSGYGFLKELGRGTGKRAYERLDTSLTRLGATMVEVLVADRFAYSGSLVEDYYRDEDTRRFKVKLNPKLINWFDPGYTKVQFEERLSLPGQLAKRLHIYIHAQTATENRPHRIGLEKLQQLCASSLSRLRDFKRKVQDTMEDLEARGVITRWRFTRGGALEFVRPNPTIDVQ